MFIILYDRLVKDIKENLQYWLSLLIGQQQHVGGCSKTRKCDMRSRISKEPNQAAMKFETQTNW